MQVRFNWQQEIKELHFTWISSNFSPTRWFSFYVEYCQYTRTNRQRTALQAVDTPPSASSRACLYTNDGALMCVVKTENDCFRVFVFGAGVEALLPIPNRYRQYRPIPSTRCQYQFHRTSNQWDHHLWQQKIWIAGQCSNVCTVDSAAVLTELTTLTCDRQTD